MSPAVIDGLAHAAGTAVFAAFLGADASAVSHLCVLGARSVAGIEALCGLAQYGSTRDAMAAVCQVVARRTLCQAQWV
jgi:hypothetical protein